MAQKVSFLHGIKWGILFLGAAAAVSWRLLPDPPLLVRGKAATAAENSWLLPAIIDATSIDTAYEVVSTNKSLVVTKPPEVAPVKWRFCGVVASGQKTSAVVEIAGIMQTVTLGQSLPGGLVVKAILNNALVVTRGDETITKKLYEVKP